MNAHRDVCGGWERCRRRPARLAGPAERQPLPGLCLAVAEALLLGNAIESEVVWHRGRPRWIAVICLNCATGNLVWDTDAVYCTGRNCPLSFLAAEVLRLAAGKCCCSKVENYFCSIGMTMGGGR